MKHERQAPELRPADEKVPHRRRAEPYLKSEATAERMILQTAPYPPTHSYVRGVRFPLRG
jgi:hypothetical protein